MKNLKFIVPTVTLGTTVATAALALSGDVGWAVVVATAGILVTLMVVSYSLTKSLQTIMQRQAGLLKQSARSTDAIERTVEAATRVESRVVSGSFETTMKLPSEVSKAYEDLTLASRALTVPQAHFDQLLRTISANTVRTESALNTAVDELRMIVRNPQTESVPEPTIAQERK